MTATSFRISDLTGKRPHVPDGLYTVRTVDSRRVHPVACTPGYRVEFEVTKGEAARGRFAHIVWLGEMTPEQSLEWLAPFDVGRPQALRNNELDGFELLVAFERVHRKGRYHERVRVLEVLSRPKRSAEQDARLGHTEFHWQQNPPPGEYDLLVIDQAVARGRRRKRVGWHLTLEVRSGHYEGYTISYFLPTDPIFAPCGRDVLAALEPGLRVGHPNEPYVGVTFEAELDYANGRTSEFPKATLRVVRSGG